MAWNEIPAKDDEALSFQTYYVRLNALHQFLSPLNLQMFEVAWDRAASERMRGFRRSQLVGALMSNIIRALGLDEICEVEVPVGGWFVHSGVTKYRSVGVGEQVAHIVDKNGVRLEAAVRSDCRITTSAGMHMRGSDDVSLVVGRKISTTRFDLVAAGYRDPLPHFDKRELGSGQLGTNVAFDTDPFANLVPNVKLDLADEFALTGAVIDAVDQFTAAVERQGAWKMLYDRDGGAAHETRHQGLFRLFSQLTFSSLNIRVHPNSDHGQGPTDITLCLRDAIHVVEFKKDTSDAKLLHGLQVQLPRYMDSAGALFGSFIVMCHERSPQHAKKILEGEDSPDFVISTYFVDCRKQKSASKAEAPPRSRTSR